MKQESNDLQNNREDQKLFQEIQKELVEIIAEMGAQKGRSRKESIISALFYVKDELTQQDIREFTKIYDTRNPDRTRVYNLNSLERKIFLQCIDIKNINQLKEIFKDTPEATLIEILKTFEEANIVFNENDKYLALPLHPTNKEIIKDESKEHQDIITCNTC